MMTKFTRTLLSFLLALLVNAACSKAPDPASTPATSPGPQRITSEGVVKAATERIEIPAGGSAEATVRLTIQNGYHVNANPPTFSYLRATKLEVPSSEGVSAGAVVYPKAVNRKFPFAEESLAVYEGEAVLKATLKADKTAKKGERSLPARLSIQACDDQVCYPPGEIELTIPVNVN